MTEAKRQTLHGTLKGKRTRTVSVTTGGARRKHRVEGETEFLAERVKRYARAVAAGEPIPYETDDGRNLE